MHGDVAYCKKHGHDWKIIDRGLDLTGDMIWHHVECQRCGVNHIIYSFFEDVE